MGLRSVIDSLKPNGLPDRAAVISLAKGLVGPDGEPPTALPTGLFGLTRTGSVGGPAHAREMVSAGARLVAASSSEPLATALAGVFVCAGVVCEESDDPVGVELAGVAKHAAALASGASVGQGLNVAGAAAGHIFSSALAQLIDGASRSTGGARWYGPRSRRRPAAGHRPRQPYGDALPPGSGACSVAISRASRFHSPNQHDIFTPAEGADVTVWVRTKRLHKRRETCRRSS